MDDPRLHLVVDRESLLTAIQAAEAVAPANSTKPILTNLLVRAQSNRIEIMATDSQVGLRTIVPGGRVEQPGEIIVSARQLGQILKESSSPAVTIRMVRSGDQFGVEISLSDGDYQIQVVVGETFPEVQAFPEGAGGFTVPGERFSTMLERTSLAMDQDRASPVLSGLSIVVGEGRLVMAATDGKVLAETTDEAERYVLPEGRKQFVLPASTVHHLQRLLGGDVQARLECTTRDKVVAFRIHLADGMLMDLTSRLIDGNFPSYAAAITPSPGVSTVTFLHADLSSAVRRAALMTNNTSRGIVMALENDRVVFSNLNFTNGSARIPVSCRYTGASMRLGFSCHYLTNVLRVIHQDTVTIELARGMVIRQPGAVFLVMPITLPN